MYAVRLLDNWFHLITGFSGWGQLSVEFTGFSRV